MKKFFFALLFSMILCQSAYAGEWRTDKTGIKYLQDDGTYKTGWHQDIDGKWYYFDDSTGYMLTNSQTPDGFTVDASGVWIEEGVMATSLDDYDNCVELNVSTPTNNLINYSGPLKVHYNNRYKNNQEGDINILNIALSKEGIPYIQITVKDIGKYIPAKMTQVCKFTLSDGSIVDMEKTTEYVSDWSEEVYSLPILGGSEMFDIFRKNTVTSAETWINEYKPESK